MESRSVRFVLALTVMVAALAVASQMGVSDTALLLLGLSLVVSAALIASIPPETVVHHVAAVQEDQPTTARWLDHPDFSRFLKGFPNPVLIVGDGSVLEANEPARQLLGSHIVGADVRTAIRHPAAAERLANPRANSAGGASDVVGLGRSQQRWEMRTIPLSDRQRIVILTDQSLVESAERMRTDFVANASHELRTPLSAIVGFIETLVDTEAGDDAETRNRFLGVMAKEARRMQQLIDDLISLSRIEADKYRTPADPVDLVMLTDRAVVELGNLGSGSESRFIVQVADNLPPVAADASQIMQVLHNILGNALKYGRADGMISVTIDRPEPSFIRVKVVDEGDGIAAEHLPRLTERFYRVDTARSRVLGGTGLGLSIVKHIVERHKGRLDIASELGQGTTVSIRIPVWQGPDA